MLEIIFGENSDTAAARALQGALKEMGISGTLYLGYPVLSTADAKVFIDGLLLSEAHGLIAFDLSSHLSAQPNPEQLAELAERQNQIYASIYNKLNTHGDLRRGRSLGVEINVITCSPTLGQVIREGDVLASTPEALPDIIRGFPALADGLMRPLNAAIQRVSTLRPPKRRDNVTRPNSRGGTLKKLSGKLLIWTSGRTAGQSNMPMAHSASGALLDLGKPSFSLLRPHICTPAIRNGRLL